MGIIVAGADQVRVSMIRVDVLGVALGVEELVPGDGHVVGPLDDVEGPVRRIEDVVVVDPDVRSAPHFDGVVATTQRAGDRQIPDDDVVPRDQELADQRRVGAHADDRLVGRDEDAAVVQGSLDQDGERTRRLDVVDELLRGRHRHGRPGGAAGGGSMLIPGAGPPDRCIGLAFRLRRGDG